MVWVIALSDGLRAWLRESRVLNEAHASETMAFGSILVKVRMEVSKDEKSTYSTNVMKIRF